MPSKMRTKRPLRRAGPKIATPPLRLRRLRRREAVPQPAQRRDLHPARLELAPQPVHVHLDGVLAHALVPPAQVVDDLLLADEAAFARQEDLEHADFACRELDDVAADARDAADGIEGERA